MGKRRHLSEVIGALVVLAVVIMATLSMLRLGQEVVSYSQRVSSQDFARSSEEATPPAMSVIVRNSTLYMLVSYPVPINISYAVLNISGRVIVERVDRLVSGEALLQLLSNYSCQNVSIELVSSAGAVFRYVPSEDPLLQGRAPPGVYYFSCSFLSAQQGRAQASTAYYDAYASPYRVSEGVPISTEPIYIIGMNSTGGDFSYLGTLKVTVNASGWFSRGFNVTVNVNGTEFRGLAGGAGQLVSLGSLTLGNVSLEVLAFSVGGLQPYFGISIVGPGTYVNFTGSGSVRGSAYYYAWPPSSMDSVILGLEGNTTGEAYAIINGVTYTNSGLYYHYVYYGNSSGWGSSSGPIALATTMNLSGPINATMQVSATLYVKVWRFTGAAYALLQLPGPLVIKPLDVVSSYGSPLAYIASRSLTYAGTLSVTVITPYGNATEALASDGDGFIALAPSANLIIRSAEPFDEAQEIGLQAVTSQKYVPTTTYVTLLWATRLQQPIIVANDYGAEINASGSSYIVVAPSAGSGEVYVNGVPVKGPVLVAIGSVSLQGLTEPIYVAKAVASGASVWVGDWSQLNATLPAGAYLLWGGGDLYWLVVSGAP